MIGTEQPTIVVLDGVPLNHGDLKWEALGKLGSVTVYERTAEEEVVARSTDAHALLTNKTPLTGDTLRCLKNLRYIGVLATGYNIVDVDAARALGITVTNIPTYGTASVAQFVFALLLELCHNVGLHDSLVHSGEWSQSLDWSFWRSPLVELAGKTMGVIGYGRIGQQVATIARALQMNVIISDRTLPDLRNESDINCASIENLLAESDVVSLHCPLVPETLGLINAKVISLMKKSAILINTSRGPLVVERDLADALNEGRLAGAALDVLSQEPPTSANPLLTAKNCIITPHIAWATYEARSRLLAKAVENLAMFLKGEPHNVISR